MVRAETRAIFEQSSADEPVCIEVLASRAEDGWVGDFSVRYFERLMPALPLELQVELAMFQRPGVLGLDHAADVMDLIIWATDHHVLLFRRQLAVGARWIDPDGMTWTVVATASGDLALAHAPLLRLASNGYEKVLPIWQLRHNWVPDRDHRRQSVMTAD